jgi:uncharacterized membrane protein (UPF0127 family)
VTKRIAQPRTRGRSIIPLLVWMFASALACGPANGRNDEQPDAWMTIGSQRVALELALTRDQQAIGLGRRDSLDWDHGMLFSYDQPGFHRFWMKDMRFDIDIVWIRGDRVVDISHRVPHVPGGNGPTVRPRELADRVLEVPAGYAQAHGWHAGQLTLFEQP